MRRDPKNFEPIAPLTRLSIREATCRDAPSCDAGSFSAAAKKIGTTRQAVQKRIARLEEELGLRLFDRSSRRARPTPIAKALYDHGVAIRDSTRRAAEVLARSGQQLRGRLRISASPVFARFVLPPIIADFQTQRPGVRVDVSASARSVDHFDDNVDLAIRLGDLAPSSSLHVVQLGALSSVVVASPAFAARHDVGGIESLTGLDEIRYGVGDRTLDVQLRASGQPVQVRGTPRLVSNSIDTVLASVAEGHGFALVPWIAARQGLDSGELAVLIQPSTLMPRRIQALFVGSSAQRPILERMVELLRQRVPIVLRETDPKVR